jgi:hypothetical protein
MNYVTIAGRDYLLLQTFAQAINRTTATLYNYRRAGIVEFCYPLGKALTFVSRETVERFLRLRITEAIGAFADNSIAIR